MRGVTLPLDAIGPGNKRAMFTQRGVIRHQMAVELTPDQLIKPDATRPALQRLRLLCQQAMQTLTRR